MKTTTPLLSALLLLLSVGCTEVRLSEAPEVEGDEAGECDDGVDNDQDGDTDCADEGCENATACAGDDDDATDDDDVVDDDDATDDDDVVDDDDATDDDDVVDDDDTTPDPCVDEDGDGVTICGPDGIQGNEDDDCDDDDILNFPGNSEYCDGQDNDCDGQLWSEEIDDDGDLQTECDGDCDDVDDQNWLGNTEICDGQDNDCNGFLGLDELDGDIDGVAPCDGDCDDGDDQNFPGNTEICDGQDNDCDTFLGPDEIDDDLDLQTECDGDCDDADDQNWFGNTEICDGQDNDCNTFLGPDEIDGDTDTITICDGDCDDTELTIYPGAPEICEDGIDQDCNGLDASCTIELCGPTPTGLDVLIIDSAGYTMDEEWERVLTADGHTATIGPTSDLENLATLESYDLVIVANGVGALSAGAESTLDTFVNNGGRLYLQGEYQNSYETNQLFSSIVNNGGGSFTAGGTVSGSLNPNPLECFSSTPNPVTTIAYYWYGATGTSADGSVVPILNHGGQDIGWAWCQGVGLGYVIHHTDQDTIQQTVPNVDNLMRNFIAALAGGC
ncbi:MAG: hypothetical protein GY898_27270 [Proteobacteria bacterium]|nr:hypothetical protein [Pseudomonadota bacterium]